MASITVRNLDDSVKKGLRKQAAENGRSLEAEVREILGANINGKHPSKEETGADLFDSIRRRFEPFGFVDLPQPIRRGRRGPSFK
jgi:plasmid stability protein